MKDLIRLFFIFAKMGVINFGGGYALLPVLQKEIVEKRGWATNEELQDYFAIGQCTPGVISVNVSTFIGYKLKGVIGGIIATFGFLFPSIIIILLIASILNHFSEYRAVQDAFAAIRVCVVVLILSAVVKLFSKSIIDIFTFLIFITILLLSILTNISSIYFVIIAGILGILINSLKLKMNTKKEKK